MPAAVIVLLAVTAFVAFIPGRPAAADGVGTLDATTCASFGATWTARTNSCSFASVNVCCANTAGVVLYSSFTVPSGVTLVLDSPNANPDVLYESSFYNYGTIVVANPGGTNGMLGTVSSLATLYNYGTILVENTGGSTGIWSQYGQTLNERSGKIVIQQSGNQGMDVSSYLSNAGTITIKNIGPTGLTVGGSMYNSGVVDISLAGNTVSGVGLNLAAQTENVAGGTIVVTGGDTNTKGIFVHPGPTFTNDAHASISLNNTDGYGIWSQSSLANDGTIGIYNSGGTGVNAVCCGTLTNNPTGLVILANTKGTGIYDGFALNNLGTIEGCGGTMVIYDSYSGNPVAPCALGRPASYKVSVSAYATGGTPLTDATVELGGTTGYTGLGDIVTLTLMTPGTYSLVVSAPGYATSSTTVDVTSSATSVSIYLAPGPSSPSSSGPTPTFTATAPSGSASGGLTGASATFTNGGGTASTVDVWFVWYNSAGQVVSIGGQTGVAFAPGQSISFTSVYGLPGTYTVKVFVTGAGFSPLSAAYSATVTVS